MSGLLCDPERFREDYLGKGDLRESGFLGTEQEWEASRRMLANHIGSSGSFLDLGCANGRLLYDLRRWCSEKGLTLDVHGVDFVTELITKARLRFPDIEDQFVVGDVNTFEPRRVFTYVRTEINYFPMQDARRQLLRYLRHVDPQGLLIVTIYDNSKNSFSRYKMWIEHAGLGPCRWEDNGTTMAMAIIDGKTR